MAEASYQTVQGLRWRVIADRLWSPATVEAYALNPGSLTGQAKIAAHRQRRAATAIHDSLFPEDPDG